MRIEIATDGSPSAARAVTLAAGLAWPPDTSFRIVSVLPVVVPLVTGDVSADWSLAPLINMQATVLDEVTAMLAGEAGRLAAAGRAIEMEIIRGRPASAVADDVGRTSADLLILGNQGRSPLEGMLLGSVSAELADAAPCPVLVVRRSSADRVVFADDGSPTADAAARVIAEWSVFRDASITIVAVAHVDPPLSSGIAPTMFNAAWEAYQQSVALVREHLGDVVEARRAELASAGITASTHVLDGDPADEIVRFAASIEADLVVVGSRGLTGLNRLVLGSTARNVLLHATSSVLIARPPTPGSES